MSMVISIVLRNLAKRKTRTMLTVIGIGLALAVMISTFTSSTSLEEGYKDVYLGTTEDVDFTVLRQNGAPFTMGILNDLQNVENLKVATPRIVRPSVTILSEEEAFSAIAVGINQETESQIGGLNLVEGDLELTPSKVWITSELSSVANLRRNSNFVIAFSTNGGNITVRGFQVSAVVDLERKGLYSPFIILMDHQVAEDTWNIIGMTDQIIVNMDDPWGERETLQNRIEKIVNEYNNDNDDDDDDDDGKKLVVVDRRGFLIAATATEIDEGKLVLAMISGIGLLVAIIYAFNAMTMTVRERKYEVGMLRALGNNKRQIVTQFSLEIAIIAVLGCILGLILAVIFTNILTTEFGKIYDVEISEVSIFSLTSLRYVFIAFFFSFLGGLLAVIIETRKLIEESIRPEMRKPKKPGRKSLLIFFGADLIAFGVLVSMNAADNIFENFGSLGFLILSVLPVTIGSMMIIYAKFEETMNFIAKIFKPIFGNTSKVAAKNITSRRFTSVTIILILSIGITFGATLNTISESEQVIVKETVRKLTASDIVVIANPELPLNFSDQLSQLETVEASSPLIPKGSIISGQEFTLEGAVFILAINATTIQKVMRHTVISGDLDQATQNLAENNHTIIINKKLATNAQLNLEQNITLEIEKGELFGEEEGSVTQEFTVKAVVDFDLIFGNFLNIALLDFHTLFELGALNENETTAQIFMTGIKPGITFAEAEENILESLGSQYLITIFSVSEIAEDIVERQEKLSDIWLILTTIITTIAIIATVDATATSLYQRRKELTMMRVLGMRKLDMNKMITTEVMLLGITAVIIGLLNAFLVSVAFIGYLKLIFSQIGINIPFQADLKLIGLIVVFNLLALLIASLIIAYKTSKTTPLILTVG